MNILRVTESEKKILTNALFVVLDNKLDHDVTITKEEHNLALYMDLNCEFSDVVQKSHWDTTGRIQKKYKY